MERTVNEQQKAELEAEVKATLADFIDHQQRALAAAGKACETHGTPQFKSHLRVAGATSLAGFRILAANFAGLAAECEDAGLCDKPSAAADESDSPADAPGRKSDKPLRVQIIAD